MPADEGQGHPCDGRTWLTTFWVYFINKHSYLCAQEAGSQGRTRNVACNPGVGMLPPKPARDSSRPEVCHPGQAPPSRSVTHTESDGTHVLLLCTGLRVTFRPRVSSF